MVIWSEAVATEKRSLKHGGKIQEKRPIPLWFVAQRWKCEQHTVIIERTMQVIWRQVSFSVFAPSAPFANKPAR